MTSGLIGKNKSILFPGCLRRLLEQEPNPNDNGKERPRVPRNELVFDKVGNGWTEHKRA